MSAVIRQYTPLIYLLKCALHQVKPDPEFLMQINYHELKQLCSFHSVSAPAAFAIISDSNNSERIDPALWTEWRKTYYRALRRSILLKKEISRVCGALGNAGIEYVKLKGSVTANYYPKPELREMSDVDLLIDNRMMRQAQNVMEALGYQAAKIGHSNHDVYTKAPDFCFEIHEELFSDYHRNYSDYYVDCRKKLIPHETNRHEKQFSDDDFYIYSVAHGCKHLNDAGIGLRALADMYILNRRLTLNHEYIQHELAVLGIVDTERILSSLAEKLFSQPQSITFPPLTEEEKNLLEFLLESGTHGTTEQHIRIQALKRGGDLSKGKRLYLKQRIFPRPEYYQKSHPFFYRHKSMRPFLVFVRLGDSVIHNKGKLKNEIAAFYRVSQKKDKKQ